MSLSTGNQSKLNTDLTLDAGCLCNPLDDTTK